MGAALGLGTSGRRRCGAVAGWPWRRAGPRWRPCCCCPRRSTCSAPGGVDAWLGRRRGAGGCPRSTWLACAPARPSWPSPRSRCSARRPWCPCWWGAAGGSGGRCGPGRVAVVGRGVVWAGEQRPAGVRRARSRRAAGRGRRGPGAAVGLGVAAVGHDVRGRSWRFGLRRLGAAGGAGAGGVDGVGRGRRRSTAGGGCRGRLRQHARVRRRGLRRRRRPCAVGRRPAVLPGGDGWELGDDLSFPPRPRRRCRASPTCGPPPATAPPAAGRGPARSPSATARPGSAGSWPRWACSTSRCRDRLAPADDTPAPPGRPRRPVDRRAGGGARQPARPGAGPGRPGLGPLPQRRVRTPRRSATPVAEGRRRRPGGGAAVGCGARRRGDRSGQWCGARATPRSCRRRPASDNWHLRVAGGGAVGARLGRTAGPTPSPSRTAATPSWPTRRRSGPRGGRGWCRSPCGSSRRAWRCACASPPRRTRPPGPAPRPAATGRCRRPSTRPRPSGSRWGERA